MVSSPFVQEEIFHFDQSMVAFLNKAIFDKSSCLVFAGSWSKSCLVKIEKASSRSQQKHLPAMQSYLDSWWHS
jgi:hypothetical protein